MRLEGKVALITGGARGMGAAEAKLFSQEGAKVVIADILEDEGRQTEAEINETGGDAIFIRLDVTQQSDWDAAIERTVREFGKLDVIVNNAGIVSGFSIEDTTVEEWDRIMDVNAKGVFLGSKAAIVQMKEAGYLAALSSTSHRSAASSGRSTSPPPTTRPRERCGSSPRPQPSSTPRTESGSTRYIQGESRLP